MKRTIPAVLTHLGLLSLLLSPLCASASTEGFRERYSSDVDGQTWMLHIDSGRSFPSMISAKLQMGDALNRYILLGSVNGTVITGSYKPLRASAMAEEKPFSLTLIGQDSVALTLDGERYTLSANDQLAAVDDALIGTWSSDAKLGGSIDNPYMGEQWSIHFRADGTACEATRMIDSRRASSYQDPCSQADSHRWKAENGKILFADDRGEWREQFTYRIMGGRMVVSYPGGQRRVTSPVEPTRISAQ
ncbi:hypothetical protein [Spongiibacter marinus]|uniref:hypothetical protein n=1 Tax=Spongiibacter marinus TaxID=354246 RepID=UPI003564B547